MRKGFRFKSSAGRAKGSHPSRRKWKCGTSCWIEDMLSHLLYQIHDQQPPDCTGCCVIPLVRLSYPYSRGCVQFALRRDDVASSEHLPHPSREKLFQYRFLLDSSPRSRRSGQPSVIAMELKGKWAVTSVKSSGTILSEDEEVTVVWEFRTRQLEITLVSAEGRRSRSVTYPITTDPTKRPKQLDASSPLNQKLGFTSIYKLEGDILTICWNVGVFRPQAFESSPSDGFTITTLQRQPDEAEVDQVRINPPQD
jgi:uncharacterized protein (TIGR03067 family)